jgi:serine/threonine-protein kinase
MTDIPPDEESPNPGDLYAIGDLLGEGPTGKVFRAVDRRLQRTVALKIMASDDPDEVARLQKVARAHGRVVHEHVCRVYDVGVTDGRAFVAMQHIAGRPLRSIVTELDVVEQVELIEKVARGVQAAHARGLIHRDIKPSNIMVERRPDGRLHPYVVDFGIAGDGGAKTAVEAGTPSFMAPEQLRENRPRADHLTDVYSLGATLFAVLAEQVPFFGPTRAETVRMVLDEEPLPVGLVVPGIPRDLETIVAVAMSKRPGQRYPSAGALADDLRRWLDGEPIRARSAGPVYRLSTRVRARWVSAATLAVVVTASVMAAGSMVWMRHRESRRAVLVAQYQHDVEMLDRLLRRARMMPLHDTTAAEVQARRRLEGVRATLLAEGSLARGAAYHALGFGHLMLREPDLAEPWLRAALEDGFDQPAAEAALGIALTMQILEGRALAARWGEPADDTVGAALIEVPEPEMALGHLLRGENPEQRARFHQALALYLDGQTEAALEAARDSSEKVPWLYEALELEAEMLVLRSVERERRGEVDRAMDDLQAAGRSYGRAMEIARSDPRVFDGEGWRLLHLLEVHFRRGEFPLEIFERTVVVTENSSVARPDRAAPLVILGRAHCLRAKHLVRLGQDPSEDLSHAMRLAREAVWIEPDDPDNRGLLALVTRLGSESVGAGGG